jgi:hypothetical protein
MKIIIKICPYLLCLISFFSYSQALTITTGTSVTIINGADFYVNGIVLSPGSGYTISGPTTISRTDTPIIGTNGESIKRVFNFSNPITNFQGWLTFFYEDSELNGLDKTTLKLQSYDGTVWSGPLATSYLGNSLAHYFVNATLASVTATGPTVTLSINKFNKLEITLFPNPVISNFQIATDLTIETLVYNNIGQEVFRSKQKNIDVSQLSAGTYLIIVKDMDSNNFNSYKIIKL